MRRIEGFTLIEMLVVVAILGILAAIGIPSLLSLYNPLKQVSTMVSQSENTAFVKAKTDGRTYCLTPVPMTVGGDATFIAGFSFDPVNPPSFSTMDTTSLDNFQHTPKIRLEPALDVPLPDKIVALNRSSCTQTRVQGVYLIVVPKTDFVYMATGLIDNYLILQEKPNGTNPYIKSRVITNDVGQSLIYYYRDPGNTLLPNY